MTAGLVVNADDLGLSHGVNDGIVAAHRGGIVTSTSLMVRQPAAGDAASIADAHPRLGVGLHVDLCEWVHTDEAGWTLLYQRVPLDDIDAVATEVDQQLDLFRRIMGRSPTHLDSHQHVHRDEPIATVLRDRATALRVPLRETASPARYCGDFYGQSGTGWPVPEMITPDALLGILRGLGDDLTEIGCHAGYAEDTTSTYQAERRQEVAALCHPRVAAFVSEAGISLYTYADVGG